MSMIMSTALPDPDYDHAFYDGVPAKRLFAWVVDVLIVTVVTFILGLLTLSVLWWIWPLTFIAVSFLYRAGSIAAWSATPGMRLMNIELRNSMGARFSGGEAVLHTLAFMVATGFVILQIISIVMMVLGSRHQGLHDILIGSAAINRPR
jgi:uncharacterized RDD family membrane protein YckC